MFLPSPTRIPLLSLHSGFVFRRLSSFLFPFRFRVIVLLQLRRIIISSILIIYYKRDVIVLRYAPGLFQAYFLCLSLFSPFITKLLKGAIFRLKNIFTKLLLPPQKFASLGGRLVRLVVKPALHALECFGDPWKLKPKKLLLSVSVLPLPLCFANYLFSANQLKLFLTFLAKL